MVTSATRRRMLRQAWDSAPEGDGGLLQRIRELEAACNPLLETGSLRTVGANGQQSSLSSARQGEVTAIENADTWTQIGDLCESVTASLAAKDDLSVFNAMMATPEMLGISNYTANFMYLSK